MWITRRVLAILAVGATLFLVAPTPAQADRCDDLCKVGLDHRVVQLVADGDGTCALTDDGQVYCWGGDAPDPLAPARTPLLLVTIGALLVAGGTTLLMLSRASSPTEPRPGTPTPPA
jgi:hypothetical protein